MPVRIMGILNMTPDSFWAPSRSSESSFVSDVQRLVSKGAEIIDLGAVSTRPGAPFVDMEEEWARLEPALNLLRGFEARPAISIDTTRTEIVARCCEVIGPVIVNDVSAGEEDPGMLNFCAKNGLSLVAMHKRGNPHTMDALASYPDGVIPELISYFTDFSRRAEAVGLGNWILDPGLGFAKTDSQNWEILERLSELLVFGRPVLIGASDKRFTGGDNARAESLAIANGASIIRKHL